jgi:hypothetical protein
MPHTINSSVLVVIWLGWYFDPVLILRFFPSQLSFGLDEHLSRPTASTLCVVYASEAIALFDFRYGQTV